MLSPEQSSQPDATNSREIRSDSVLLAHALSALSVNAAPHSQSHPPQGDRHVLFSCCSALRLSVPLPTLFSSTASTSCAKIWSSIFTDHVPKNLQRVRAANHVARQGPFRWGTCPSPTPSSILSLFATLSLGYYCVIATPTTNELHHLLSASTTTCGELPC